MMLDASYIIEDTADGLTLVMIGAWSDQATRVLAEGEIDGLLLNYARGFSDGNLEFLDSGWGIRRLDVLDRTIADLGPIGRLGGSLQMLSVEASPAAELDLAALPELRSLAGEWVTLRATLGAAETLECLTTWRFDETDLHAVRDHVGLQQLTIKEALALESLSGIADLPALEVLQVLLARQLHDIGDVVGLARSLRELEFEDCPALGSLADLETLVNLTFLGCSDCGNIDSLAPLANLLQLEVFHAWGSTCIDDGDLSPLKALPQLKEIRMRDRRKYSPRVTDLPAAVW